MVTLPRSVIWAIGAVGLSAVFATTALSLFTDSRGFMPHGHCYLWRPDLVAVHVTADSLIGLSYTSISLTLAYLVYRSRGALPFHWMAIAFGTFIIACGATHFAEVWTLWRPDYWMSGNFKIVTAIASVATAVALPPLVPRALSLLRAEEVSEQRRLDLNERDRRLAEADRARREAEAADRAKDQFLAVVSHELRNPLSPILAWARMLRAGNLDAEKQRSAIESIERNATAQAQPVDDLLDLSRVVAGKLRLDVRPTPLPPVIEAAIESIRPSLDAKQVRLQVVLDPNAGTVLGDPGRLQQIVWNLLSNAVKFTPKGGRVQVGLERVNSHVEIVVSDTGKGIAPDRLSHVFDRFWQEDASLARAHGGLGLGLSIVRHLVELHGGEVEAYSEGVERGARFRVKLPLLPVSSKEAAPDREHPRASIGSARLEAAALESVAVLVVDDETDSNEAVKTILTTVGAEVRVAASAEQARRILDRWRPDVIVSDIGMPGEDGYALIGSIRARAPEAGGNVPAVALTAYARVEDRVRALNAGFQMHVVKPVDPAELVAVVATLSRSSRR